MSELRLLKLKKDHMTGNDVKSWQNSLIKAGFKLPKYGADSDYGSETEDVTKAFQKATKIEVDGKVGPQTRDAMNKKLNDLSRPKPTPNVIDYLPIANYPQVELDMLKKINVDLQGLNEKRTKCVQEILKTVFPYGLYIRGGNSYTTSLKPNYVTAEMIRSGADRQPQYYNGGREAFMLKHVASMGAKNKDVFGADCSGNVVGIWRKVGLVNDHFDNTANGILLNTCYKIKKSELKPGDCVGKSGHMAMYVGAGYCVEAVGGAYGIQLTDLNKRLVKNQMTGKTQHKSKWTRFGKLKVL
jgi:peptidoglycan hydrolase-like protein with peptidoglycan-binding domain